MTPAEFKHGEEIAQIMEHAHNGESAAKVVIEDLIAEIGAGMDVPEPVEVEDKAEELVRQSIRHAPGPHDLKNEVIEDEAMLARECVRATWEAELEKADL